MVVHCKDQMASPVLSFLFDLQHKSVMTINTSIFFFCIKKILRRKMCATECLIMLIMCSVL